MTTPFSAGELLTAAKLNDRTASEWTAYTPTWLTAGAGADPTLGNGTLVARWAKVGKIVSVKIRLTWGSTTNGGSGDWTFSLPTGATPAVNTSTNVGTALTLDAGTAYKNDVCLIDNANVLRCIGIAIGGFYNATTPQTWATNDFTAMQLTYEAA